MPIIHRNPQANKSDHGSLGILGGAQGTVGAAFLAARCALYSGVGRVFVVRPSVSDNMALDPTTPEAMVIGFSQAKHKPINAWALGPGLGVSDAAHQILAEVLDYPLPMAIDADALNLIAQDPALAKQCAQRQSPTIMTPHPGEAARLLHTTVEKIQSDRKACARELARTYGCVALLKGAGTVIAKDDQVTINPSGNAGLASGGTGDVLTGLIGALLAQGMNAWDAATHAALIHGQAAEALSHRIGGMIGLTASELIPEIRLLLNQR